MSKRQVSKKVKQYVKKTIQSHQETNMRHVGGTTAGIGDGVVLAGLNLHLSDISAGDAQGQRQGNQITVTSVRFKGYLELGDSQNIVRIIMYIPKSAGAVISTNTSLSDPVDFDQFTVLKDVKVHANSNGNYYSLFNLFKRFNKGQRKGMSQLYSSTTSTSYSKNPLWIYMCSDSTAAPSPALAYERLLTYKDA